MATCMKSGSFEDEPTEYRMLRKQALDMLYAFMFKIRMRGTDKTYAQ